MPVQSHGGGWRARKKHGGQWFCGPVRQSAHVAEADQRKLDTAAAVSLEAVQEAQRKLTTTEFENRQVAVERRSTGWRLRIGTKENRRYGPTRQDKSAAEDDARRVQIAFCDNWLKTGVVCKMISHCSIWKSAWVSWTHLLCHADSVKDTEARQASQRMLVSCVRASC